MRVVAILATYNEERFIADCLENLFRQGIQVYLIDNDSTDNTVAIASRYLARGVIGIENFPRAGMFRWSSILKRKERLAATLEADWFMHVDADEIYPSPWSGMTLAQALAEVGAQGYNAVNFVEFTFIPTLEAPDHDHPGFQKTMRWYYPFLPTFPYMMRAWKRQPEVEMAWSGGHLIRFPGIRLYTQSFPMRHYHFLSVPHAARKYVLRHYDPAEVRRGWHGWRAGFNPEMIRLPSQAELRTYISDDQLDASKPRVHHYFSEQWEMEEAKQRQRGQSLAARLVQKEQGLERRIRSWGARLLNRYGRIRRRYLLPVYRRLRLRSDELS